MTSNINLKRPGLEIGPSYNPVVRKADGHPVMIMDHLDREGLRLKYDGHAADIDMIEEVDFIWSGRSFRETVGNYRFDWIVASHVIEHTPDLIGFLKEISTILNPGGILSLAIPDKRFCFDFFRPPSGIAHVIDTHMDQPTRPSIGKVAEHYLNAATRENYIVWSYNVDRSPNLICSIEDVRGAMRSVALNNYQDVHCWTFTPATFRLLMYDLLSLDYLDLCEFGTPVPGIAEFFSCLTKKATVPNVTRQELAEAAAIER